MSFHDERHRADLMRGLRPRRDGWSRWRIRKGPLPEDELAAWRRGDRQRRMVAPSVSFMPWVVGDGEEGLVADVGAEGSTAVRANPTVIVLHGRSIAVGTTGDGPGPTLAFDSVQSLTSQTRTAPGSRLQQLWITLRTDTASVTFRVDDLGGSDRRVLLSVLVDAFGAERVFPADG